LARNIERIEIWMNPMGYALRIFQTPASMTVWAKGQAFVRESDYANGDP
jgi:hypothetical protein